MKERVESYKNTKLLCDWKFGLGILFFMFFCMYASAPIEQYDALSKHLPITLYAARTGQYYINLIESGVYCESMVSQYGFSAAFLILGAQKALVLFNVVLMFLCIGGGYFIFSQLEPAIVKRKLFWFVGIATIPLLFEVSTIFYIDILPVFFLMISFGQLFDFNLEKIWLRMSAIAFCLGSAFFTKMTSAPYILVLGIVVFACGLLNYCKGCVGIFKLFKKYFKAIGLFIVPFIGSCFYIGYMTGNPVYYFFNSLFGSPYASMGDYADPFINPIGLNFKSLFSIVFNTSQNIELKDGALGLFLLGTVLLPVYVFWKKSKKILIWFILTLMMYQISCVFSYNLRYMIFVFLLMWGWIAAVISKITEEFWHKGKGGFILCTWIIFIIPNIIFLTQNYNFSAKMQIDSCLSRNDNASILKGIPNGKRVFSVNDCFKGEYDGFYNSFTWHNSLYNTENLLNGTVLYRDYLKSFDYVLYDKRAAIPNQEIQEILLDEKWVQKIDETMTHCLYEVTLDKMITVNEEKYKEPITSSVEAPYVYTFDATEEVYYVTQDVENSSEVDVEMRFQINWINNVGEFIDTSLYTYNIPRGVRIEKVSIGIKKPSDAVVGQLYITPHSDRLINIWGYDLKAKDNHDYITVESKHFYDRKYFRKGR